MTQTCLRLRHPSCAWCHDRHYHPPPPRVRFVLASAPSPMRLSRRCPRRARGAACCEKPRARRNRGATHRARRRTYATRAPAVRTRTGRHGRRDAARREVAWQRWGGCFRFCPPTVVAGLGAGYFAHHRRKTPELPTVWATHVVVRASSRNPFASFSSQDSPVRMTGADYGTSFERRRYAGSL